MSDRQAEEPGQKRDRRVDKKYTANGTGECHSDAGFLTDFKPESLLIKQRRGEALLQHSNLLKKAYQEDHQACLAEDHCGEQASWHVLWTRSNCEQLVHDQLLARKYEAFLPMINQWSTPATRRRDGTVCAAPMFKGYLFVRHRIDKDAWLEISNTRGVVQILGSGWNQLARVPDQEINTIKQAVDASMPLRPYPYLKNGSRVRIVRGPLAHTEGILVESDFSKGLFVVSVHLLRRSVAVQIDCTDVLPA
jgi:transcription antitermination factor NusG